MSSYNIAKRIARKISEELSFDLEKEEVIAYGIFGLLQISISMIVVFVVGIFFGVAKEALIISIVMASIRKTSGGVHATSPNRCMFIGTTLCILMSLATHNIRLTFEWSVVINVSIFLRAYYLMYKLAPVDTPNKPIKNIDKRMRLKKISLVTLTLFLFIFISCLGLYRYYNNYTFIVYANCIGMGVILQIITLTSLGHQLFNNIDVILSKVID